MRLAPLAAFGAMSFTVGKYGLGSIVSLGQADGHDVPHLRPVRGGRARLHLVALGLQPVEVPEVHQGRDLHGAGDQLVRVGGAAADAQARVRRRLQAGRRPGGAVGRDLQSRWPVHLLHDGGDLHRPGDQHAADLDRPARRPGRAAAHLQGIGRRHRLRASSRSPRRSRRWARFRSRAWCCCWVSTASCRKRAPSPTRSATRWARSPSAAGSARSTACAWRRCSTARPTRRIWTRCTRATTTPATSSSRAASLSTACGRRLRRAQEPP